MVDADAASSPPQVDSLDVKGEKAGPDVSARLGSVRRVLDRRFRYLLEGRPVEFATSCLPLDIARGTAIAEPDPGPCGIYARLEELGYRLAHFEKEIRARMPSLDEVCTLRLAPGVPVTRLIRTAYGGQGGVVERGVRHLAADAYVLPY
ncbi:UTRA domain-containing protein [Streptomyces sp. McG7]|nr:UTRA domain-containing protein [Streptomyces sp. McG7]